LERQPARRRTVCAAFHGWYGLPVRTANRLTLCLLPLLSAAPAAAEPLSPVPGLSGPVGPAPDEGARVHDGFYFRLASGFGVYDERLDPDGSTASMEVRNRGIAATSELSIGGTIAPGWVLGGSIYSLDLVASTLRASGASITDIPAELDPALRNASLIGPFLDWYPNVRGGFHAQVALGLATLTPRVLGHSATDDSEYVALGGGIAIGVGYEWWVADEWSIGVLSQLGARLLRGDDEAGTTWRHVVTTSPNLSVSLTYH
jgi:hypothetical protein